MKILVVSDTHGILGYLQDVVERVSKVDMMIHLGDVISDVDFIRSWFDCPCHMVRGNCDFDVSLPGEEVIEVCEHRIFITHGHAYHVGFGTEMLKDAAKDRGCDIALYGHTHVPYVEYGDICVANPGSVTSPRQEDGKHSYMLLEFDRNGNPFFNINYI